MCPLLSQGSQTTQLDLRTATLGEGQQSKTLTVHLERVARGTTVTHVLETLLKQANMMHNLIPLDPDAVALRHVRGWALDLLRCL